MKVDDKTRYNQVNAVDSGAIAQGKCITALGKTKDQSGALQATAITLAAANNGKAHSIIQPMIASLYNRQSAHEILQTLLQTPTTGPLELVHMQSVPTSHPDLRLVQMFPADERTRTVLVAAAWLVVRKHPKMFQLWGHSLQQKSYYDPRKS